MPLRNLLVIFISALISLVCYGKAERNRYAATLTEAMNLIEANYLEEVEPRELFENAMNGMVSGLDQYSSYFSPGSYKRVEEALDQEFGGIGIIVESDPKTKLLTVMSPLVDTPAYRAGMRAGDLILRIGDVSTEGMSLKDSVTLMRGKPGSEIRLLVLHAGDEEPIEFIISREIIPVESVLGDTRRSDGSWRFSLEKDPRIGYVRVTQFGKHTVEELKRTLRFEDQSVEAFVLDVRNNAGGLLGAAVDTCDMFIDEGRIVSTRGRGGKLLEDIDATSEVTLALDLPMVVLTNRYSASASEIVAACVQDHGRAIVVGERTWGKGTVQNILELENGRSALKLTTASYWRPSGKNIHRGRDVGEEGDWGVRPNEGFEVELTDDEFERWIVGRRERDVVGAKNGDVAQDKPDDEEGELDFEDPQLERAVEYLKQKLNGARAAA